MNEDELNELAKKSAESVIQFLESASPEMQQANAWIAQGIAVVDSLIAMLSHPHTPNRSGIVWALGKIGDMRALRPLLMALTDPDPMLRSDTLTALGFLGDAQVVEAVIGALHDTDPLVRTRAVRVLVRLSGATHLTLVRAALDDPDLNVRLTAVLVLKEIHSPEVTDGLLPYLNDPELLVRASVAEALGKIGDDHAVRPLINTLQHDSESYTRAVAAEALGRWQTHEVLHVLEQALFHDTGIGVGSRVANSLGRIGTTEAFEVLLNWLDVVGSASYYYDDVVSALIRIGLPVVSHLLDRMRADKAEQPPSAYFMVLLGVGSGCIPLIVEVLPFIPQRIQEYLLTVIARYNIPEAQVALQALALHQQDTIRLAAVKRLEWFKDSEGQ